MYKKIFSLFGFLFLFFAFSGLASAESGSVSQFTFENAAKRAVVNFTTLFYNADDGIMENKNIAEIKLNGSLFTAFVQGSGGAGTYAPNANNWDGGANTKYWHTSFSTIGYKDLQLSSKQYGSSTGPRDFKVQWSLDGTTWTDVAGSSLTVAANWTSGALSNVALPTDIEDKTVVHLRWIMTSNTNVGGGVVGTTGTNRIDDVNIAGTPTDIVSFGFEDAVKLAASDFVSVFYTADDGIAQNKDISDIQLNGSLFTTFVQGSGGAGTNAPSSNNWDNGADTKYWHTSFSTIGYKDLQLSSKQYGSSTGPRDFKVQWSLDGTTWTDVAGSSLTLATNWTSGVLNNLPLPNDLEDKSVVYLRWIMTSNTSIDGLVVGAAGATRIDDIFVGGRLTTTWPVDTVKTGLIAYWPFDVDTNDYSGNNNHGVNYGAVGAAGKINGGYSFSALNAYIGAPQSATLNTAVVGGDFTMSFWGSFPVKTDKAIISQSPGSGPVPKWMFAVQNFGNDLGFFSWGNDGVERRLAAYNYPTHTDLQFYTLVKRGNNYLLYKNASQVGYSLTAPIPLADLGMDFEIARAEGGFYYKEILDEVTIWGRALNTDEIEYLYNGGTGSSLMDYTLSYTAGPNGSLTGLNPQVVRQGYDGTAVTAVPNIGYHFVDWSDASTANPRTDLAVTGDITVTANFAINTYTLTYTAGANGSLTGLSPQFVNHGADGTTMTAVPDPGYVFIDWSDASTANPRTDLAVTGDVTVTANFGVVPPAGGVTPPVAGGRRPEDVFHPAAPTPVDEGAPTPEDAPFTDIDGHWAEDDINRAYDLGYISGYEDNTFRPDNYITRAEASSLIAFWYDENVQDYVCTDGFYTDVRCTDWYGKYIIFLSYKGVLEGYGNEIFEPMQNVTRAEALKMLLYAKDLQNSDTGDLENPFSDVYPDNWFYNVVMVGYMYSYMQDNPSDSTFEPFGLVTRAEFTSAFLDILL